MPRITDLVVDHDVEHLIARIDDDELRETLRAAWQRRVAPRTVMVVKHRGPTRACLDLHVELRRGASTTLGQPAVEVEVKACMSDGFVFITSTTVPVFLLDDRNLRVSDALSSIVMQNVVEAVRSAMAIAVMGPSTSYRASAGRYEVRWRSHARDPLLFDESELDEVVRRVVGGWPRFTSRGP